jgi:hypothetical protein
MADDPRVAAILVKAKTIGKAYLTRKADVTATGELQIEVCLPSIVIETEIVESPVPGKVTRG